MLVDIDLIEMNGSNVRQVAATAIQDSALRESIQALGILQSLLVRRGSGEQFQSFVLIAGHRRLRIARELGLAQVPVEICELEHEHATAGAIAENLVRASMHPVDQWRAIVRLQREGYALADARRALGLEERMARRLDVLGRMAPVLVDAIAATEMPPQHMLAVVASAPLKVQIQAAKKHVKNGVPDWYSLMQACSTRHIPRSRAIFDVDTADVVFEEDLFAEPGSDAQWTTTDVAGFLDAQRQAVAQRVSEPGSRHRYAELDRYNAPKIPKGFERVYDIKPGDKLKRGYERLLHLQDKADAYECGRVDEIVIRPLPVKKSPAKSTPTEAEVAEEVDTPDGASDAPTMEPEKPERDLVTRTGMEIVAQRKTEALRAALRLDEDLSLARVVSCLVLALHADNVEVRGYDRSAPEDLLSRLIDPAGQLIDLDDRDAQAIGFEAVARVLHLKAAHQSQSQYTCGSGRVAEWIGHHLNAEEHFERFDTSEFLAQVAGSELKSIATSIGYKGGKKIAELRSELVGKAEDWRPSVSDFGTAGPSATREKSGYRG